MKAIITVGLCVIGILLTGCLGHGNTTVAPTLAFTYVVGEGDNGIRALSELSTGQLQPLTLASFATNPRPVAMALHPSKNFLYVANLTANTVSIFTIDHVAGILTPAGSGLPPTPVCGAPAVCSSPVGVAVSSDGHFLFVLNQGSATPAVAASISVFNIDLTRGLLTSVSGSPFTFASLVAPNPQFLIASPTAGFLYVANGTLGNVSAFSVGNNGTLAEFGSGFPIGAGGTASGSTAAGLAIDPKGQFLYVADTTKNTIASFGISGGLPAPVAGSPFPTDLGPVALTIDATSTFLYSANNIAGTVSGFKISSGTLAQIAGSPFPTVTGVAATAQPSFLTVDVSNTFLLVANLGSSDVSVFGINSTTGTLGMVTNSPFPVSVQPLWIVTTQ